MLFVLCSAYIILHNVFNTFNGLSHSCLSGSFEIAKVKIEGQMQKRSFGCWWTTYWLATSGNLRRPPWRHAMTCHDMPWHAMTCHDMPWHAMTCLHPVSGVSDAYLPSTSVYRFEHFDYMNHTLLEAFQGHDSVIQGCFLVTMICWVEILMWRALRTCLDWNWLPRAVLDQSAIRFYNSEQVLCWLHWMLQCILGDALDKSLQIWLEVQYVGMANQLCSATLRETWTSRLPR